MCVLWDDCVIACSVNFPSKGLLHKRPFTFFFLGGGGGGVGRFLGSGWGSIVTIRVNRGAGTIWNMSAMVGGGIMKITTASLKSFCDTSKILRAFRKLSVSSHKTNLIFDVSVCYFAGSSPKVSASKDGKMSGGTIAGIVVGVIALIIAIAAGAVCFRRHRRVKSQYMHSLMVDMDEL